MRGWIRSLFAEGRDVGWLSHSGGQVCLEGEKREVLGTHVGGPEIRRKVLAMTCEGLRPGLPEQAVDFESCRYGASPSPVVHYNP